MDRRDFYKRQTVKSTELDAAFQGVEDALDALVTELDIFGVVTGFAVSESAVPALSADITDGVAYDSDGKRCVLAADTPPTTLALDVDYLGNPTTVLNVGNSRWLTIFAFHDRDESDPRIDHDGQPLNFVRLDSVELRVVQGSEAASPTKPAVTGTDLVLADVLLEYGDTSILDADIDTARRTDWPGAATPAPERLLVGMHESVAGDVGTLALGPFGFEGDDFPNATSFEFEATIYQSDTSNTATIELYSLTAAEVITTSVLTRTGAGSSDPAVVSATLTVGTGAGEFRTTGHVYRARLKTSSSLPGDTSWLGQASIVCRP